MKTEKLVQLAAVTLMLCAAAGCRKSPQNTTPLLGRGPGAMTDRPSDMVNPITGDNNTTGIAASDRNFDNWPADRDTFRDQTVYFEFDKANVKASELPKLEAVASQMRSTHNG